MPCILSCLIRSGPNGIGRMEYRATWLQPKARARLGVPIYVTYKVFNKTDCDGREETYARPLRSLISSSHTSRSHQGMATTFLLSRAGTKSSHLVTSTMRESYTSLALLNMSLWIVLRSAETALSKLARGMGFFVPVSRRTVRVCCLARSLGPISRRRGTPYKAIIKQTKCESKRPTFCSQSLNLYPGV